MDSLMFLVFTPSLPHRFGCPLCLNILCSCAHTGADVQMGCGQDSPLHAAVRGGGADIVDLLMDFGADGCCKNAEGKTPLELSSPNSTVRIALQKRGMLQPRLSTSSRFNSRMLNNTTLYICSTCPGPCSLSQLCRFCIRRSLGRSRLHRASGLFLPHSIKDFLLYQEAPPVLPILP